MPIAAATATDVVAAAVFESTSPGIGLAPTAEPPACAVASPTIIASKPAAISLSGLIDMMARWGAEEIRARVHLHPCARGFTQKQ